MTAVALPLPRAARAGWLLTATLLLVAAGVTIHAWPGTPPVAAGITDWWAMPVAAALGYGVTGAWLGRARPDLPIGPALLVVALVQAVSLVLQEAGVRAVDGADTPTLAVLALWVGTWLWLPGLAAIPTVLPLLLPEGRVPVERRPALRLALVALGLNAAQWALEPFGTTVPPLARYGVRNPFGIAAAASPAAVAVVAVVTLASIGWSCGGLVRRWRRATGDVRQQLTWVLYGGALTGLLFGLGFALGPLATALTLLPLPAACLVAILRYGLWDVDLVVSRSLVYGLLTGAVVATYAGSLGLLGGLLGTTTGAPIVATALVAVGIEPVHRRLRSAVNRLVHGGNDDPYEALSRLGGTLGAARDAAAISEQVLPEVVAAVARALHLPYVALVLSDGTRVEHGSGKAARRELPLTYAGSPVGALVVADRPGGATPLERRLLDDLAQQAAVAVHTVGLTRQLARSREAVVTAREEERRRLHTDLHDGLGPALAALALQVEAARDLTESDPAAARQVLDRTLPRLAGTVSDVRTLVQGLRPPALDDLGLAESLRELATRFATPRLVVAVAIDVGDDVSAAAEVAAYRIVSEALTNAARHADASFVDVVVRRSPHALELTVADDGRGFDDTRTPGTGLRSMRDRAEELGGSLRVTSSPAGTTIHVVLPT